MERLVVDARVESLDEVTGFLEGILEKSGCPEKSMMQVRLAAEEIFINIAKFAYGDETGKAEILCWVMDDPRRAKICFSDSGVPFNPMEHEDPDLSVEALVDREGGLGIFLVKNLMDDVFYSYEGGRNRMYIVKVFA